MNKFKCESIRLCRFLYSLGFEKESRFDEKQNEYWLFERSQDLQKSLDFFFSMRKIITQEILNDMLNDYHNGLGLIDLSNK